MPTILEVHQISPILVPLHLKSVLFILKLNVLLYKGTSLLTLNNFLLPQSIMSFFNHLHIRGQGSISSTFYARVFHMKVLFSSYIQLCNFLVPKFCARKTLLKLRPGRKSHRDRS